MRSSLARTSEDSSLTRHPGAAGWLKKIRKYAAKCVLVAVVLFYDLWVAAELQNHHAALIVKGLLPACSEVKASHCLCKESLSVGNPKENNSLLPAALTFPLVFTPTFNLASSQDCNNSHSAWRQHHTSIIAAWPPRCFIASLLLAPIENFLWLALGATAWRQWRKYS